MRALPLEDVSIHAPRVGGDQCEFMRLFRTDVSIHAPRVGGDSPRRIDQTLADMFQSTPPAWGATCLGSGLSGLGCRFNPRPPRGGRRADSLTANTRMEFQSTPPAWGATVRACLSKLTLVFQSTPPAWGATKTRWSSAATTACFNPRPPRGGRPMGPKGPDGQGQFQSTPPAWGATR